MSKTVYIVTSGEYSGYHIDRVFSTKELAEKWIGFQHHDRYSYYEAEEWEVDPDDDVEDAKRGYARYYVTFFPGTEYMDISTNQWIPEANVELPLNHLVETGGGFWKGVVEARDYEHAAKIVNEQVGMLKARLSGMA